MRQLAHPTRSELVPVDVEQLLRTTLTVTANEYKYVADLDLEIGPLPPILGAHGDLAQVFMNLIVNAAHAISDAVKGSDARGRLVIRAREQADLVTVTIADTGTGIPDEIAGRIFDPFFTTKEVGRGTGQGLAIARVIVVDGHHGALEFESEPGQGTVFSVTLPIAGRGERLQAAAA